MLYAAARRYVFTGGWAQICMLPQIRSGSDLREHVDTADLATRFVLRSSAESIHTQCSRRRPGNVLAKFKSYVIKPWTSFRKLLVLKPSSSLTVEQSSKQHKIYLSFLGKLPEKAEGVTFLQIRNEPWQHSRETLPICWPVPEL